MDGEINDQHRNTTEDARELNGQHKNNPKWMDGWGVK